ncbi:MAG: hypothetical protein HY907_02905 [Deltaproteobacteria bacterium]|nr:hypothetical protein [Deltaproteobacteria bacterium]
MGGVGCEEEDDEEGEGEECVECHVEVAARWANPSSHELVLDCPICHAEAGEEPGPQHRTMPECATCHSERSHLFATTCTACHDPHGSANAFLLRETITTTDGRSAPVHVTAPEGASADGLARAGVTGEEAGTGLCEACHDATTYYTNRGDGAPHHADWCPTCHSHQEGFLPSAGR